MIEIETHKGNRFVITLDDEAMGALMAIVAGANMQQIQTVGELIRYELEYMAVNFHTAIKEPGTDGNPNSRTMASN